MKLIQHRKNYQIPGFEGVHLITTTRENKGVIKCSFLKQSVQKLNGVTVPLIID